MVINKTSETSTAVVYSIKGDGNLTAGTVEAAPEVKDLINGKKYGLEGDMEDPTLMWLTIFK